MPTIKKQISQTDVLARFIGLAATLLISALLFSGCGNSPVVSQSSNLNSGDTQAPQLVGSAVITSLSDGNSTVQFPTVQDDVTPPQRMIYRIYKINDPTNLGTRELLKTVIGMSETEIPQDKIGTFLLEVSDQAGNVTEKVILNSPNNSSSLAPLPVIGRIEVSGTGVLYDDQAARVLVAAFEQGKEDGEPVATQEISTKNPVFNWSLQLETNKAYVLMAGVVDENGIVSQMGGIDVQLGGNKIAGLQILLKGKDVEALKQFQQSQLALYAQYQNLKSQVVENLDPAMDEQFGEWLVQREIQFRSAQHPEWAADIWD